MITDVITPVITKVITSVMSALEFLGLASFTPASLFTGGYTGGWYDPSDLSTMFQDSAGTIPVTADGDPVGCIDDKSGNGNHLIQATSSARPLYKTSGGLHWLDYDGIDDELAGPNNMNYAQYTLIQALSNDTFSGEMAMLSWYHPSHGFIPTRSSTNFGWYLGTGGSFINPQIAFTGVTGQTEVMTNGYDGSAHKYRYGLNSLSSTPTTNGSNFNASAFFRAGKGIVGNYFDGIFYGGIYINRYLNTTELDDSARYLGLKGGRTL